jgi:peptide deformylase
MLSIVEYPNAGLKRPLEPVIEFKPSLAELADQMLLAMYAENGVGLAAPQVGFGRRLLVMDPTAGDSGNASRVLVNPQIIEVSDEMVTGEEGCLSIPGVKLSVPRHAWVTVEYLDTEGQQHKEAFVDWAAKIVQHEIDHLDGILMLDRVGPLQRQLALKDLRRSR